MAEPLEQAVRDLVQPAVPPQAEEQPVHLEFRLLVAAGSVLSEWVELSEQLAQPLAVESGQPEQLAEQSVPALPFPEQA